MSNQVVLITKTIGQFKKGRMYLHHGYVLPHTNPPRHILSNQLGEKDVYKGQLEYVIQTSK